MGKRCLGGERGREISKVLPCFKPHLHLGQAKLADKTPVTYLHWELVAGPLSRLLG